MAAALTLVLAGCGGARVEETAPPPTPLPELPALAASAAPSDSPEPPLRVTADPESAWEQLRASIPPALVGRCGRAEPTRGAVARADCEPATGADALTYLLFDGEAPMSAAWAAWLDRLPDAATDGPGCGSGPGRLRLPDGRAACYEDADTGATTAWINELAFVLAVASRSDGDWAELETFRQGAGPVTP